MGLLLLNWVYIFVICLGTGVAVIPFFTKEKKIFFILLSGLFSEMVIIHFYAIFFAVDTWFYLLSFILALSGIFINRSEIYSLIKRNIQEWKAWKPGIRTFSILVFLLILMQSATAPFINDNESYYIQSVKWLNHFGLVKGLANLHIFLGQMSGWHLLQSGFNFGFCSNSLNDINGFLFVICSFFFLFHLNSYFKSKLTFDLFLGLIPAANLFLFTFISSPSPDLPVFLLSQIIFYLFYTNANQYQKGFRLILMLCVFLIMVKPTMFPLLILPAFLFFKHKLYRKDFGFLMSISLISLSAFCIKNYIISGYILYPTQLFQAFLNPDWKISPEIQNFYYNATSRYAITSVSSSEISRLSSWEYFRYWLQEPGLRSFFNKLIILLLLIFPFFIKKSKPLLWLYIYALIQFFILFLTSPQYRFFFPLILGMSIFILTKIFLNSPKFINFILWILGLTPVFSILFPVNLENLRTTTSSPIHTNSFKLKNLIYPAPDSQYKLMYEKVEEGNLYYFSPVGNDLFFWITGDGRLPCAHKEMIDYFKEKYKIRPQLRTSSLKDGFKFEKIKK